MRSLCRPIWSVILILFAATYQPTPLHADEPGEEVPWDGNHVVRELQVRFQRWHEAKLGPQRDEWEEEYDNIRAALVGKKAQFIGKVYGTSKAGEVKYGPHAGKKCYLAVLELSKGMLVRFNVPYGEDCPASGDTLIVTGTWETLPKNLDLKLAGRHDRYHIFEISRVNIQR